MKIETTTYLKPSLILLKYEKIAKIWNAQQLGYLGSLNLVRVQKLSRSTKLNVSDVLKIYHYYNTFKKD